MKLATATVIAVLATSNATFAQQREILDVRAANYIMPGCKQPSTVPEFIQGYCLGMVSILAAAGHPGGTLQVASAAERFCLPKGVNLTQVAQVAVSYIEARPARWHEEFFHLALEAFRAAWPCR
ncbi:MAG: Rap1a immunity protein [Microvirga sp.]|jgi:hypothetical protein|nr:Rap1a immunity protein [Microvirga sp.]